ncbi:MAG: DUF4258 domain-containing protein [Actinobacteria bacterium]|nr:DUF4258 domain-containing protein [Actinomycetota bacterium]
MAARNVAPDAVRSVLVNGEVIEEDVREGRPYPTRLILGWVGNRPLHVLVARDPEGRKYVITVYEPTPDRWSDDFRTRRSQP